MPEQHPYLSRIFGDKALRITTRRQGKVIEGIFRRENAPHPLTDVVLTDKKTAQLTVTNENCAGHFAGPLTFPAYQMLVMGALLGDGRLVDEVRAAEFKRIVTPGQPVTVAINEQNLITATRTVSETGLIQTAASFEMYYANHGVTPQEIGIFLEIAAQTMVAAMADHELAGLPDESLLFPLIQSVAAIEIWDSLPQDKLIVVPHSVTELDNKNSFTASAEIVNDDDYVIAEVSEIQFLMVTAQKVGTFIEWGQKW